MDMVERLQTFKSIAENFANTYNKRLEKNKRNKVDCKHKDMRGNASTHAGDSLFPLLV